MPPNGDTEQLSEELKLNWAELPRMPAYAVRGCSEAALDSGFYGSTTENPEVDPVRGPGRTEAEVRAEAGAYMQRVRAFSNKAVFQADFLFVKAPGQAKGLRHICAC